MVLRGPTRIGPRVFSSFEDEALAPRSYMSKAKDLIEC